MVWEINKKWKEQTLRGLRFEAGLSEFNTGEIFNMAKKWHQSISINVLMNSFSVTSYIQKGVANEFYRAWILFDIYGFNRSLVKVYRSLYRLYEIHNLWITSIILIIYTNKGILFKGFHTYSTSIVATESYSNCEQTHAIRFKYAKCGADDLCIGWLEIPEFCISSKIKIEIKLKWNIINIILIIWFYCI